MSAKAPAYHHGHLRAALLKEAASAIRRDGVAALSLRELARRAGVSHAAPQHHFGDKTGLLTALATEGFELFAGALEAQWQRPKLSPAERFEGAGMAYVEFALSQPAHFELMFKPTLVHAHDAAYVSARLRALDLLVQAVRDSLGAAKTQARPEVVAMAAWAVVHGFSQLWLDQNLQGLVTNKKGAEELVKSVLTLLSQAVLTPASARSK